MKKIAILLFISLLATTVLTADVIINEDFEDGTFGICDTVDNGGSENWEVTEYSSNYYAQCSGFGGTGVCDDWIVLPAINFDDYENESLTFMSKNGYNFNDALEVVISTDYDGTSNPSTASWTVIPGYTLCPHTGSGYGDWTESGAVDLTGYTGTGYIAYHYYKVGDDDPTTTWQIDDIQVSAGSAAAPTATTDAATSITHESATLNGTVNANNASTTVTFEWGETTGYGNTVTADQSPVSGSANTSVSAGITGLSQTTTYHYRVKAVNSEGTTYGDDISFITNEPFSNCLYISEVSDDDTGGYQTAYMEIYNNSADLIDMENYYIERWQDGSYDNYAYTIGAGVEIPAFGLLVVARGADEATFEADWGIDFSSLNANYDSGSSNLYFTTGRSYKLFHSTSLELDASPAVDSGQRAYQQTIGTWIEAQSSSSATPGQLDADQTLPVELSSFSADYSMTNGNEFVMLSWETASETDVIGFNIFRAESLENYDIEQVNLNLIDGNGTTTEPNEYTFEDITANIYQNYYYWLEVANFGGSTELLGPYEYDAESSGNPDPTNVTKTLLKECRPNPVTNSAAIQYQIKGDSDHQQATIQIFNVLGQVVKTVEGNNFEAEFNVSDLSNGIYFYKLETNNYSAVKKFMVMK